MKDKIYVNKENGNIHFGNEAPQGGDWKKVENVQDDGSDLFDKVKAINEQALKHINDGIHEKTDGWRKVFLDKYKNELTNNAERALLAATEDNLKYLAIHFNTNDKSKVYTGEISKKPEGFDGAIVITDVNSAKDFYDKLKGDPEQLKTVYNMLESGKQNWQKEFRARYEANEYLKDKEIGKLAIYYNGKNLNQISIGNQPKDYKKVDVSLIKSESDVTPQDKAIDLYINLNNTARSMLAGRIELLDKKNEWQEAFVEYHTEYKKHASTTIKADFKDEEFSNYNAIKTKLTGDKKIFKGYDVTGYKSNGSKADNDAKDVASYEIKNKNVKLKMSSTSIQDASADINLSSKTAASMAKLANEMIANDDTRKIFVFANSDEDYKTLFKELAAQGFKREHIQYAYLEDIGASSGKGKDRYEMFEKALDTYLPEKKAAFVSSNPMMSAPQPFLQRFVEAYKGNKKENIMPLEK